MRIVYTDEALHDLDDIFAFLAREYPSIIAAVEERIRAAVTFVAEWPESAPRITQRSPIRVKFIGKYPYRVFYRIAEDRIEILHVHHTARRLWRPGAEVD